MPQHSGSANREPLHPFLPLLGIDATGDSGLREERSCDWAQPQLTARHLSWLCTTPRALDLSLLLRNVWASKDGPHGRPLTATGMAEISPILGTCGGDLGSRHRQNPNPSHRTTGRGTPRRTSKLFAKNAMWKLRRMGLRREFKLWSTC